MTFYTGFEFVLQFLTQRKAQLKVTTFLYENCHLETIRMHIMLADNGGYKQ